MIKLRKPFSQKIHLHIRQNMLQRLWDKYVPASSSAYEQIQLVYLKGTPEEMEKQPEQVQLLIQLILKNKMMQLNLMQYPALVKVGQKQMERRLRQIERFYAAQLKSCDFTMFRTVRHYFALLDQAEESSRRYQSWLKDYQEIEKQREEYRLLSLFSVKLRELLTERSVNTLRTMEREFVDSLSKTEYRALAEELIWQEKPELIAYLKTCNQTQCEEIFKTLEKDIRMKEVLSLAAEEPVKEKLTAVVEQLEQKEFCLFYHQVMELEDISPQMVIWKESRTQMLHAIDGLESGMLQQVWKQLEEVAHPLEQNTLRIQEKDVIGQNALQTLERSLEYSLSETEYQTFVEELIWQEKPELIAYLKECTIAQCEEIVSELENDVHMSEVLSLVSEQPVKENLIAAAEQLEQKTFRLFYHRVMDVEDISPQMVVWKESKTEMLDTIDRMTNIAMKTESLRQIWEQVEKTRNVFDSGTLRVPENNILEQDTLRIQEKELVYSLLETEYQTFAEELIWKEKPEFVAYLKECSKARCKEIVKALEKDVQITEVLSSVQKQSVRKKLVAAARKLKQPEFSRLYWQVVELKGVNPPLIIWKKNRTEMLHSFDGMNTERLQEAWAQMEAAAPVKGMKTIFSEKMQHLQNQYQQNEIQNVQEQITAILKENDFEKITDIVDVKQLMQGPDTVEFMEKELTENTKEIEPLFEESNQLTIRDEIYQVIQRLEHERQIRREQIDRQQVQVAEIYQETYAQILETEDDLLQQQENVERIVEQTFVERHREKFTKEEIQNIREWSRAFLEVCFVEQESADSSDLVQSDTQGNNQKENQSDIQGDDPELVYMVEQINHYMEEQHGLGERLILNWQKNLSKDERIQNILRTVRKLEKEQKQNLTQYLADMIVIWQEFSVSDSIFSNKKANAETLFNRIEATQLSAQEQSIQEEFLQGESLRDSLIQRSFIQDSTYEFAESVLRIGDRELAGKLLQIENREFAKKLLQIEDMEIVRRFLQVENREAVEKLLQDNDIPMPDVSYRNLWEWGETLMFHPEYQQEQEDADIISVSEQDMTPADGAQQEDIQTQVIRHQIAMAKDRNHLQRLIRQINHQADTQLVYADAQLKLPQVQSLLNYIRQLDEKQYGVLVKELAQITKIQKMPYKKQEAAEETNTVVSTEEVEKPAKTRALSYPVLVQRIHDYEKQHRLELYKEIGKTEQKIFPKVHEKVYEVTSYKENEYEKSLYERTEYGRTLYERIIGTEYGLLPYEEMRTEYGQTSYEEMRMSSRQSSYDVSSMAFGTELFEAYEKTRQESKYQPQKLEYSTQKAFSSEEDQQRNELRMQQETAQIKSVQEQLDKKLKEVESQLKKVEDSAKAKEDVSVFAEQVKRQLYEELHVEKLRRGLV